MSRPSKIGRLPAALREELNRRLAGGEVGFPIVDWLNSHPDVQPLLEPVFQGYPISEQNLSDWRRGGYAEWEIRQDFISDTDNLTEAVRDFAATGVSAGHFMACLKVRFASNLLAWDGSSTSGNLRNLQTLQRLCNGVLNMRRSEQQDERRALDCERLEFAREKHATSAATPPKTPAENLARPARHPIPIPPPAANPPAPAIIPPPVAQATAAPTLSNPSIQPNPPAQSIPSTPPAEFLSARSRRPAAIATRFFDLLRSLKTLAAKITPPYQRCVALAGAALSASPKPSAAKPSPPPTPAKPAYHRPPADPAWFRGAVAALMASFPEDAPPAQDDNDPTLRYPQ